MKQLQKEVEREKQALLMLSMKLEKDIQAQLEQLEKRKQKMNVSARKLAIIAERIEGEKRKLNEGVALMPFLKSMLAELNKKHPELIAEVCMEVGISPDDFKKIQELLKG